MCLTKKYKKSSIKQTWIYKYLHHHCCCCCRCCCSSPANVSRVGENSKRRPGKHTRPKESINTKATNILGSVSIRDVKWPAKYHYWHHLHQDSYTKYLRVHNLHGHQRRKMRTTGTNLKTKGILLSPLYYYYFTHYTCNYSHHPIITFSDTKK